MSLTSLTTLYQERSGETLPDPTLFAAHELAAAKTQFTVYTDIRLLQSFLTHPAFKITTSKKTADILWISDHFKDFRYNIHCSPVLTHPCMANMSSVGNMEILGMGMGLGMGLYIYIAVALPLYIQFLIEGKSLTCRVHVVKTTITYTYSMQHYTLASE